MTLAAELARCDREIAEAAAYTGPDEIGALMGWADWMIEKEMIVAEISGPRAHLVQPGLSAAAEPVLRSGARPVTGATMCSGIGAPECAAPDIDWLWHSEIDPFPCAVHAAHFPKSKNLGDMTKVDWTQVESPDVLVAGTPCQAFSVTGLRQSLNDARGNLTLEFARAVHIIRPRFVIWENVPGVLSTDDNAYGCFLSALIGADAPLETEDGKWPSAGMVHGPNGRCAWRILDAQFFGVAQRRRRLFVVRCPGDGADPGEILFERPRLLWYPPTRKKAGERIAGATESGADGGVTHSLTKRYDSSEDGCGCGTPLVPSCKNGGDLGGGQRSLGNDIIGALCARDSKTVGNQFVNEGKVILSVGANKTTGSKTEAVSVGMAVRRLTPTEAERLQGFPDSYTAIDGRADGPRYRALGNSMAVPVMAWLLKRIRGAA